jgi:spore photoproduct lyase
LKLQKIYIDQSVKDNPIAKSIRSRLNLPWEVVDGPQRVYDWVALGDDPVKKGKNTLFLTRNRGAFLRDCPGTRDYICCGYKILHIGTYCTMDCSYCVLQTYFHPPLLQYFVNHKELFNELEIHFSKRQISRIGTGEFTDSMIWETWTDLSNELIPRFAAQSKSVLELKTKTISVAKLKNLTHGRKTIMAWSLNTETVMASEERGTASLSARLGQAALCESWGYPLAFHFDPMILYHGCEAEYRDVVEKLFSHVSPENVVWISIGTFRFIPTLKQIIQRRFKNSKIVYGEFIPGLDGKMRYFKPLRMALYQKIVSWIKEMAPDVLVYFCMEDDEVWQKTFGFVPSERGGLSTMLDESAVNHCGLDHS